MNSSDFRSLDPDWAWAEFEPSNEQPWNRRLAAHLFRRAGFGANSRELDEAIAIGVQATVSRLLDDAGQSASDFERDADQLAQNVLATNDAKNLSAWWLYRILNSPRPLVEKLTLFWHGHFATSADKVTSPILMYEQNRLLRQLALGDFSKLALEISRDPAMLIYLDSASNRKTHPNENYARELMELFCLGEGNYTERDVQELARCFTGWEIRGQKFRFNRFQHDTGTKSFLGQAGPFPGEQAVEIVVGQRTMPKFIVRKLIRYLVCDEPEAPDQLVEPLANLYRESGLQTRVVVERILRSQLFFSKHALGRKIRSPVELLVGFLRSFQGTTNLYRLANDLSELGHALFYPPNVKGWDGGRAWINSSTLLARANAIYRLLHDENTRLGGARVREYLPRLGDLSQDATVDRVLEIALAVPIDPAVRKELADTANNDRLSPEDRWINFVHVLATLPEFQFN